MTPQEIKTRAREQRGGGTDRAPARLRDLGRTIVVVHPDGSGEYRNDTLLADLQRAELKYGRESLAKDRRAGKVLRRDRRREARRAGVH